MLLLIEISVASHPEFRQSRYLDAGRGTVEFHGPLLRNRFTWFSAISLKRRWRSVLPYNKCGRAEKKILVLAANTSPRQIISTWYMDGSCLNYFKYLWPLTDSIFYMYIYVYPEFCNSGSSTHNGTFSTRRSEILCKLVFEIANLQVS